MGLGLQTVSVMILTFLSGAGQTHGKGRNCVRVGWASHPQLSWEACETSRRGQDGDSSVAQPIRWVTFPPTVPQGLQEEVPGAPGPDRAGPGAGGQGARPSLRTPALRAPLPRAALPGCQAPSLRSGKTEGFAGGRGEDARDGKPRAGNCLDPGLLL